MRKKFRGHVAPPKENANAMPVLFPDSFNRNGRGRRIPVRAGGLLGFDVWLIFITQNETTFDFTEATDTKAVRTSFRTLLPGEMTQRSCGGQLNITVEKTVDYGSDPSPSSIPYSSSPALSGYPTKPEEP